MGNLQRFSASLDKTSRIVTAGSALVLAGAIYTLFNARERLGLGTWIIAGLVFGSIFAVWLFRPTNYTITEDGLLIGRPIGSRRLLLKDIASVEAVSSSALGFQLRVFGSGGFGGYFGVFRPSGLGRSIDYYVTNMSNLLLIRRRTGRELLISPDDPVGFEVALRSRLSDGPRDRNGE